MSFMSQESGMSLSIPQKFRQSAQELKNVHTLTGVSVLLAMSVVISFMASVRSHPKAHPPRPRHQPSGFSRLRFAICMARA